MKKMIMLWVLFTLSMPVVVVANATPRNALGAMGQITPYPVTPALEKNLKHFNMKAYIYKSPEIPFSCGTPWPDGTLPFVLFTPEHPQKLGQKLPLILFLHGLGERGSDLNKIFHQAAIFQRTSKNNQAKYSCYLLAPQHGKDGSWACGNLDYFPPDMQLSMEILEWLCVHADPPIDRDRIYVTGLSSGGEGTYEATAKYPGIFAAALPISTPFYYEKFLNTSNVCHYWHVRNHAVIPPALESFQRRVIELGGEFRIGVYDRESHDAWNWAYSEPSIWNWVFAQSRRGPVQTSALGLQHSVSALPLCHASSTLEAASGQTPDKAVDGLLRSQFASKAAAKPGDYLQVDFDESLTNTKLTIFTGTEKKQNRLEGGTVEISFDGRTFHSAAEFKNGQATIEVFNQPLKSMRVVVTSYNEKPLVVREILPGQRDSPRKKK